MPELSTAESAAIDAETLPAFVGLSLMGIRSTLTEMLALIGRQKIFSEYTVHDISHIDAMLKMLDWVIPPDTAVLLTPADRLMQVLAVYFHDLGMLVTEAEYQRRDDTIFPSFVTDLLSDESQNGREYQAKLRLLDDDSRDRFLYQEFVRQHHASRVRLWIEGKPAAHLGDAKEASEELARTLAPLGAAFREDLAIVCESHHRDDLDRVDKYDVSKPYGNSKEETANVQYAAILLRTVDLLHITSDRTPSVTFRLISPRDPMSQREWAKQRAVSNVRAQYGRNREGLPDEEADRSTIEVYARFESEEGFFGLTSYLAYAERQLQQSNEWAELARAKHGAKFKFPWRYIDQSKIRTEGFDSRQFEFRLDQERILDLLTGHTIYNDADVVLRELVQNALDAVRLRLYEECKATPGDGLIEVNWNHETRTLEVLDNGTGMTQDILEQHFLKVGSSRYQDPIFKEKHPDFSAISRFGIGVLSTFMLADTVEVVTMSDGEEEGRRLLLRDVHGKYLIRFVSKQDDADAERIGSHGTLVRLKVRETAKLENIAQICAYFFVLPAVPVTVNSGQGSEKIGHQSLREALAAAMAQDGADHSPRGSKIEIREHELDGFSLAYAVSWVPFFNEWTLLEYRGDRDGYPRPAPLGICVEGVRVEDQSPGFRDSVIYAIANAFGKDAPKTNVARSGLEEGAELSSLLRKTYRGYLAHVQGEFKRLTQELDRSLTWAAYELPYLMGSLAEDSGRVGRLGEPKQDVAPRSNLLLEDELRLAPLLLIERDSVRAMASVADLEVAEHYWTVDSAFFRHAAWLIREVPNETSYAQLAIALTDGSVSVPEGLILCSDWISSRLQTIIDKTWEPEEFRAAPDQRRIDAKWARRDSETSHWLLVGVDPRRLFPALEARGLFRQRAGLFDSLPEEYLYSQYTHRPGGVADVIALPVGSVGVSGLVEFDAVRMRRRTYLLPEAELSQMLRPLLSHTEARPNSDEEAMIAAWLISLETSVWSKNDDRRLSQTIDSVCDGLGQGEVDWKEFRKSLRKGVRIYDINVWSRKGET